MNRTAYTSTVFAPFQIAIAVVFAAIVAGIAELSGGPWWAAALVVLAILLTGLQVATVRLSIGNGKVLVGMGPWGLMARRFAMADVVEAEATNLGWRQIFGVGAPFRRRTTRLTIRPGPTLVMTVRGNELVRISTADPERARELLQPGGRP